MSPLSITDRIVQKENIDDLVREVVARPELIEELLATMHDRKGTIKFGCDKIIRLVSEQQPELVYPYFDELLALTESKNSFIKWGTLITLSNLAEVDSEGKFEVNFDKYFARVSGPEMVTANNIVGNAWKLAVAKPALTDRIVEKLLSVEQATYMHKGEVSKECWNIVCGEAIGSFENFYDQISDKDRVIAFVKRQLNNSRPAVKKRAEKFLKNASQTSH